MNQTQQIGRVGGEVELRHTPSGKAVAELSLAIDDGWGENKKTIWMRVDLWGATAELAARAVRKGDRIAVQGRLSQEEWTDKETGKARNRVKIVCEGLTLLEPKRESMESAGRGERAQDAGAAPSGRHMDKPAGAPDVDDDLPF